jgi:hypothetical protein
MSTSSSGDRRGQALVVLVLLVAALALISAVMLWRLGSGAQRTWRRTADLREALCVGEAALGRVSALVNESLDAGAPVEGTELDFRAIVTRAMREPRYRPAGMQIVGPGATPPGVRVGPVTVSLPHLVVPRPTGRRRAGIRPIQGFLDFAVEVEVGGKGLFSALRRTVRQRFAFHVALDFSRTTGSALVLRLAREPAGTVIQ